MTVKNKNIPALRFNYNGEVWKKFHLNEIATKITDGTHDTPKQKSEGVPYLTAIHVKDGKIDFENCYYLDKKDHDIIYKRCNPEFGDLLVVNIGSGTATCASVLVNYEFSLKNVALIKPNKSIVFPDFLAQIQRKNAKKLFLQLTSGGAQPFLSLKEIGKLKVSLPSLPEQQKIASFLSSIDEKIQQLTRKKELLEQYKKGVMQQIFSGKLRFKPENGKAYPDWEEKRMGDVAEIIGGGTPDTLIPEYWDGDIQWYTPTEISERFVSKSKRMISRLGLEKSSAKLLPIGTILFTSRATIAELSFAKEECTTNQGFQSLVVNSDNNPEFIFYWIKNNKKAFIRKSQGSTFLEISKTEMVKINILSPCIEEQQKVANYLSAIDTKIESVANQITQTQTFKKGLLQGMFV